MTFEQFQASRHWSDDICAAIGSDQFGNGPLVGYVYAGNAYVESALGHEGATGDYVVTIERDQTFGTLEDCERALFEFLQDEGLVS